MTEYSRKQNTDNYHHRIERLIIKADELQRNLEHQVNSFNDIQERNGEVSQWLKLSREELSRIYRDESVFDKLKTETNLDINELSRLQVINELRAKVAGRVDILNVIRQQTRSHDGKELK